MFESKPRLWGLSLAATAGVWVFAAVFSVRLALADGTVYPRTLMPAEFSETALAKAVAASEGVPDDTEQQLVDKLYQGLDEQHAAETAGEIQEQWRVVKMRVTAYCPCTICCGQFSDGVTACNHRIQPGDVFVAADKAYKFRTDMVVPGYNGSLPVKVLDRGRLIKGNRLDVFFPTHETARQWGTRYLDVLVREN